MVTNLKQTLRDLRTNRLVNYGNTAYQRASGDYHIKNVPIELRELWYRQDDLSFLTLSIAYDSDIDVMSENKLLDQIDKERQIKIRLEDIFSNLDKKKVGKSNGKN